MPTKTDQSQSRQSLRPNGRGLRSRWGEFLGPWLSEERFWNTLQGEDLTLARSVGCSSLAELELEKRKKEEKQRRMEERLQASMQQRQDVLEWRVRHEEAPS